MKGLVERSLGRCESINHLSIFFMVVGLAPLSIIYGLAGGWKVELREEIGSSMIAILLYVGHNTGSDGKGRANDWLIIAKGE